MLEPPDPEARGEVNDYDRDAKFGEQVSESVAALALEKLRTSFRSPWQNDIAERWVGTCRRDLLDHIIPLNEQHLKRLLSEYVRYYHRDRTHLGLEKDTPKHRSVARLSQESRILSFPRLRLASPLRHSSLICFVGGGSTGSGRMRSGVHPVEYSFLAHARPLRLNSV
jgi:Integrase core domain